MQFDFERFSRIAARVYQQGNPYSLEECLSVFQLYFQEYEDCMGRPHPPIRAEQIARIMEKMPYIDQLDNGGLADLESEDYQNLINLHFKTRYRRCDYNINHFFSGRIRELRAYEDAVGYQ